jgi:hypothetical protein
MLLVYGNPLMTRKAKSINIGFFFIFFIGVNRNGGKKVFGGSSI